MPASIHAPSIHAPSPFRVDDSSNEDTDDPTIPSELREFQASLLAQPDDTIRFQQCVAKGDELLARHDGIEVLIADYDKVMSSGCKLYKQQRESRQREARSSTTTDEEIEQWDRFIGVARDGLKIKRTQLNALKQVSRCWGQDVLQYYGWPSLGERFCKLLATAANQIASWEEACIKLNRLMLRRTRIPGRRPIRKAKNPISQIDLENLKKWTHRNPYIKDNDPEREPLPFQQLGIDELPDGYGLDKFGLFVLGDFAAAPNSDEQSPESESREVGSENNPAHSVNGSSQPRETDQTNNPENETPNPANESDESKNENPHSVNQASPRHESDQESESGNEGDNLESESDRESVSGNEDSHNTEINDRESNQKSETRLRHRLPKVYKETPKRMRRQGRRRCCSTLPSHIRSMLDDLPKMHTDGKGFLRQLMPYRNSLCYQHLRKFTSITTRIALDDERSDTWREDTSEVVPSSQRPTLTRRLSAPDLHYRAAKRMRFDDQNSPVRTMNRGYERPHDPVRDERFMKQVLEEIVGRLPQEAEDSHGGITNRLIHRLLTRSKTADDGIDAHFWSGKRAAAEVESGNVNIPIIVESQQPFQWSGSDRPILQLFQRMGGFHREVSVQIPSRDGELESFESRTLHEVRERFLKNEVAEDPWNVLDLHNPIPSTLPTFLMGENCQLLSRVRDVVLMGNSAERPVAAIDTWNEWKNVLEWALLCEGGHNTAPHMDSHGFSTWLTVQEGQVGFGWMSRPTKDELDAWIGDPQGYLGGQWRYVVLQPGQTIFFTSATIHYVFRISKGQTLMVDTTNEDMDFTAGKYVKAVADLIHDRDRSIGDLDKEMVRKFFENVKAFQRMRQSGSRKKHGHRHGQ
ncbi:hypothetical protein CISG_06121 [Coccidioides immitis RMSCC 3703]|uniref:JmjC domain-containing protein n=1 Tax=Coccidioides immitis RMSCC 3703 TaxID=454286 RepID=A0A0J8R0C2_COCIT|nr:hypothetical protein CISG_06121 [Coccidioides immitis RMSCC 3703]